MSGAGPDKTVIRSNIVFAEKDKALRDDVRRLGKLVGELVREQAGEALFDLVEAARKSSIAHREGDAGAVHDLHRLLRSLNPRAAIDFIRAFSTYFQMVNMAEKVHRIRRRRAYSQDSKTPQPYGFVQTLRELEALGIGQEKVVEALAETLVQPVFTVQLTEVTRRTLLVKQQSIARLLVQMMHPFMTRQELAGALDQIRLEMTTGWQTEDQSQERSSGDEGEHILFFLTDVLYGVVPAFYEELENALVEVYGAAARRVRLPVLVRFGTWVGGDMDGDPTVTAKTIRASLVRQRALVLDRYYEECRKLARVLSQSDTRVGVSDALRERSALYVRHFPRTLTSVPHRHRNMPYRVFLRLIAARLQATFDDAAFPYESPEEFEADLLLIADSLRTNRGHHAGLNAVTSLLYRARTFGFHMATLDIRQHADVHRRVVGEALNESGWEQRSEAQIVTRIKDALYRRESPVGRLSSEARRTLAVFQTIAHCRRKYGAESIGPYIVSMAHGPADVLAVLLLARWGNLGRKGQPVPLDIVPFFETVHDLENIGETMYGLLRDERYRRHLEARGNQQLVMIGYGSSNQDAGAVASFWSMHRAQQQLVETARRFDVRLTIVHGRGGAMGRAGRRLHDAIRAIPHGGRTLRLRMTEQGEGINAKYGLQGIALRTLEQTVSAMLQRLGDAGRPADVNLRWNRMMQTIADESRRAYRSIKSGSERFGAYFELATPIDVMDRLRLGFKVGSEASAGDELPSDGASGRVVNSQQWEFAWSQNRCLLPAWYGFGAGVQAGIEIHGEDAIRQMFTEWQFARVLLADVELTLAKADMNIAAAYSALAGELHDEYFPLIQGEFDRSVAVLLRLTRQSRLLESSATLRRAIRLRNPYVDPMSYLQIDQLRRWRAAGRQDDDVLDALQASVNGIAHGMQNTS